MSHGSPDREPPLQRCTSVLSRRLAPSWAADVSLAVSAIWLGVVRPPIDRLLGTGLALATLPLQLLLLAATWRAFGACPVIVQRRTGLNGRPFPLLKVRTLAGPDTSSENTLDWHHDPRRLAAFGAVVRRTGLDEILQVWNVAAGQMALIGPRPWLPQEQLAVERLLPEARRRLAVRPGLIGLAAVLNRRPCGSDGYLAHATADLEYVATATPALDGRICWLALRVLMDGRDLTTGHVRSDAAES